MNRTSEHFLDASFDIELLGAGHSNRAQTVARDLEAAPLLGLEVETERLLLTRPWPEEHLRALEALWGKLATVLDENDLDPQATFEPSAWGRVSRRLAERYVDSRPPDAELLARVNGRSFAAELQRELGDSAYLGEITSVADLDERLVEFPSSNGWVFKAEHGASATTNRRIATTGPSVADRKRLEELLRFGKVHLERWSNRRFDLAIDAEIDEGGELTILGSHESMNTTDGAFLGVVHAPDGVDHEYRSELESVVRLAARRLVGEGYSGPFSIDAYVDENDRLRPLVEINARRPVAWSIRRVAQRFPDRAVSWRLWRRGRLKNAPRNQSWAGELDDSSGFVIATPPQDRRRVGVLFIAEDREGILAADWDFRERFE